MYKIGVGSYKPSLFSEGGSVGSGPLPAEECFYVWEIIVVDTNLLEIVVEKKVVAKDRDTAILKAKLEQHFQISQDYCDKKVRARNIAAL